MFDSVKLKYVPEDFIVCESVAVRFATDSHATQHLLLLRKSGFTTMEAVRHVADAFVITEGEVGYCGLKDEDGVTEQLIDVPLRTHIEVPAAGLTLHGDDDRWITLHHYGLTAEKLGIGKMEGNSFKVVLRNLDDGELKRLTARKKLNLLISITSTPSGSACPGGPRNLTSLERRCSPTGGTRLGCYL